VWRLDHTDASGALLIDNLVTQSLGGIVVRTLFQILVLPAYWTLGLHGGLRSTARIEHCESNEGDRNSLLSETGIFCV